MSRCVVAGAVPVVHTEVAAAGLHQTAVIAVEITTDRTRAEGAAVATMIADHIGAVVVPNTVASIHQTSRTRWIFRVWINPTAPAQLEPMDVGLHQWCNIR